MTEESSGKDEEKHSRKPAVREAAVFQSRVESSNVETSGIEISAVTSVEGRGENALQRRDWGKDGVVYLSDVRSCYVPKSVEKPKFLTTLSMFSWSFLLLAAVVGPLVWVFLLIVGISFSNTYVSPFEPIRIAASSLPVLILSALSAGRLLSVPQSTSRHLIVERIGLEVGFINYALFQIYVLFWYPGQIIGFLLLGLGLVVPALLLTLLRHFIGGRATVMTALKVITAISVLLAMLTYQPTQLFLAGMGVLLGGPIVICVPSVTVIVQCIMWQYSMYEAAEKGLRTRFHWLWTLLALLGSWLVTFGCYQLIQWYQSHFYYDPTLPW